MSSKNKKVIVTFLFVVAFSVGCMHDDKTNYNNEIMPTSTIDFKDTTSLLTHETTLLNEDGDIEYKSYTWQELDKLITERINLLDPLAREYIYWMHELNKEYTPKNLIMAVKYKNIGGAHFFNKEEIAGNGHTDWNKITPNAIQYMRGKTFIPIVSEMTGDYILLTAILQPIRDECSDYYGLMNEIRDTDDEIEFLKRLSDLGYY
ncbi:MAG: hypothetical protein PHG06_18350, partial [Parabacteroides sp.]|nr:hypothetical protein [Parabacteroides sp.]